MLLLQEPPRAEWMVPLDPSAGHYWSSERRIQLCLYPACETQNSDCCLGWQGTQSLLPNWPTKPFCSGPELIHTPHGTSYKELKALLLEPRRPEAYLKKMYI